MEPKNLKVQRKAVSHAAQAVCGMSPPGLARPPAKWTKGVLEKLPAHTRGAASSNYEITDPLTPGLKLQVGTTGYKVFWLRFTYRGKKYSIRIGEFGLMAIEEARSIANGHRATLDRGGNPLDAREKRKAMQTVLEFMLDYLAHAKLSKRTWKNDEAKMRDHVAHVIGRYLMSEVTPRDIQGLLGGLKGRLSDATINRVHAFLSVFFNLAVTWKIIDTNPCAGLKKLKENNRKDRFFSTDEVRRIMAMAAKDRNVYAANGICLLLMTGLRREEVFQSRYEHLDLEKGTLYLPHTKSGKSRYVTLNDAAISILKGLPRLADSPWIFPGKDPAKPLNNPTKAWHRILDAAQVARCCLHTCRHSYASMLVNEGASLFQVQQLLGHASPAMTQRYARLSSETLRNTSQLVSNLFNKS